MASNVYVESLVSSAKRLRISTKIPSTRRAVQCRSINNTASPRPTTAAVTSSQTTRAASQLSTTGVSEFNDIQNVRLPKAVQAVFLAPLKRAPKYGIPVCDLQIRSYSVRNLEAFTDFALRAAYYLKLAAKGPVPLPRITERWTVPRSNFIFKKSQENFERRTVRRLIQIQDGHPETVAAWLAYIQKHRYYGVGLKANVFEHGSLEVAKDMDAEGERLQKVLGEEWDLFGAPASERSNKELGDDAYLDKLMEEPFKAQWGAYAGMSGLGKQTLGTDKFVTQQLTTAEEKTADRFQSGQRMSDAERKAKKDKIAAVLSGSSETKPQAAADAQASTSETTSTSTEPKSD